MSNILLLEDNLSLINGLSFAFKKQGFQEDDSHGSRHVHNAWTPRRLWSGITAASFSLFADDYKLLGNGMANPFNIYWRNTGAACVHFSSCTFRSGKTHL